jgi:SAM-dependent methyltransferase
VSLLSINRLQSARQQREGPHIFTHEYYARLRDLEATSWWNEGMRDIAAVLLNRAGIAETGVVLDAGCGSGQTMSWFLGQHPRWAAIGVDVATDGLQAARRDLLPVCCASALNLPLADKTVDLVISQDVLQHLPLAQGDAIALAEFFRVLRLGGTLLLRTNAQSFPRTPDDKEFSFRKYEPNELRRELSLAGFEIHTLGRCNAVLGLAEIPREFAAARHRGGGYHGVLAESRRDSGIAHTLKRGWLKLEGRALAAGLPLPLGRTLFALCRKR